VVRRFIHDLRGDLGQIAIHVPREGGLRAGLDTLDRPRRDRGPGGVGLQAAVVAALAAPAVGIDGHVADLARHVRHAAVDLTSEPSSATAPTTMLVPPMSSPTM